MKKTSKKKKIIILIAIALIIVIIGILIGTNAIKVNILTGKFNSANNSSSSGNLLPEYIKAGITLGGVTGTLEDLDTSDATATPEDIALGKTAYVKGKKITGTRVEPITDLNPDEVYYADLPGEDGKPDGVPDGVIYADLAVGGSGEYGTNGCGKYEIPTETNLKQYYIEEENYPGVFGTGKVIAQMEGTTGINNRFYVMALEDIDRATHTWWANAFGHLDSNYNISSTANDFAVKGAEPTGLVNTRRMMECYANKNINGTEVSQGSNDMWKFIKDEYDAGWFVPSKSEWAAFGTFAYDELGVNTNNYPDYGLSARYWSSSQYTTFGAYSAYLGAGCIGNYFVDIGNCVRLSTTF